MSLTNASQPQDLSNKNLFKKTGDLPADCIIGSEYLPGSMADLPIEMAVAVTKRAMLDNPAFHQEIAYAALCSFLMGDCSLVEVTDLFLQVGYMRDELLKQSCSPSC